MAILMPGRTSRRLGYTSKAYYTRLWKGKIVVSAWPRARGKPKLPWQQASLDRLQIAQKAVKRENGRAIAAMDEGMKDYMRENTGVRGTAAIRLRDWLTAQLYGRAFSFQFPDGKVRYPASVVQDASDILDHLEPRYGSLLTRTDDAWLPTVQCKPGSVLCQFHSAPAGNACPPASIPTREEAAGGF